MIISASRRTDIPAFYTPWLINRVRDQFLWVRNPRNPRQIKHVSLAPQAIKALVFWTRNPKSLLPHLPWLERMGYAFYFHYTLTGYPRCLERSVPRLSMALDTFHRLSDLIGPQRVIWRFDPILLSNLVDNAKHKRLFEKIARSLAGKTQRVMISFADFYSKTKRNLNAIHGFTYRDITLHFAEQEDLISFMADVAHHYGMVIQTCSEQQDFSHLGVFHGKCIDDNLMTNVFGITPHKSKDKNQREACGCVKSVDIGVYNTCLHGCTYCYATQTHPHVTRSTQSQQLKAKHDPNSPFLLPLPYTDTHANKRKAEVKASRGDNHAHHTQAKCCSKALFLFTFLFQKFILS